MIVSFSYTYTYRLNFYVNIYILQGSAEVVNLEFGKFQISAAFRSCTSWWVKRSGNKLIQEVIGV